DVVEAQAGKMLLRAPVSGTVAILVAEPGEAIVPGEAVLTILPENGLWFAFNLREDALRGLALGAAVPVLSPSDQRLPPRSSRCGTGASSRPGVPRARPETTI